VAVIFACFSIFNKPAIGIGSGFKIRLSIIVHYGICSLKP
jgi:hypothetical protein